MDEWYATQDGVRALEPGPVRDAALTMLHALEDGWATMRKLQRACDDAYRNGRKLPSHLAEAVFYLLEVEVVDRYRSIVSDLLSATPGPDAPLPWLPLDDVEGEAGVLGYMMAVLGTLAESPRADEGVRALIRETAPDALFWAGELVSRAGALHDAVEARAEATGAQRQEPRSRRPILPEQRRVA